MRIAIIVEGGTERAFLDHLRGFLRIHLGNSMPILDPVPQGKLIPTGLDLKRLVRRLLDDPRRPADHVIALTDVYTGTQPPLFPSAKEARERMSEWVGQEGRFHPHAAQHEFEAWLLPYWVKVQSLSGSDRKKPDQAPEMVNHLKPPSELLREVFRTGRKKLGYMKIKHARRILEGEDLLIAAKACPELKSFLNTILTLCKADPIP